MLTALVHHLEVVNLHTGTVHLFLLPDLQDPQILEVLQVAHHPVVAERHAEISFNI